MKPLISVLLATYNGAPYLREQLQSLAEQDEQRFVILVRDDGSSDDTVAILEAAQSSWQGRLVLLPADGLNLGAAGSFSRLMQQVQTPYAAFCDQDDCWFPDKLSRALKAMQNLEDEHGTQAPLLVCSDVTVTDAGLEPFTPSSFFARHHIRPAQHVGHLGQALFRNYVIGATTMINQALIEQAAPVPAQAMMHDWWCMLTAEAFGAIAVIESPSMSYRQHGRNAVGSPDRRWPRNPAEVTQAIQRTRRYFAMAVAQAAEFTRRYGQLLDEPLRQQLALFERFSCLSVTQRWGLLWRLKALGRSPIRYLAYLVAAALHR